MIYILVTVYLRNNFENFTFVWFIFTVDCKVLNFLWSETNSKVLVFIFEANFFFLHLFQKLFKTYFFIGVKADDSLKVK